MAGSSGNISVRVVVVLVVVAAISIWVVLQLRSLSTASPSTASLRAKLATLPSQHLLPPEVCFDEELVLQIQRDQWAKAKTEVFGSSQAGFQGSDMDFYRRHFGVVEVLLHPNKKKLSSLVYYRIFKNANDNIRSLLTEYAYVAENQSLSFEAQNCRNEECFHRKVHYLPATAIKAIYSSARQKRYAFTFVRDPLMRFISAMTEVEFRSQKALQSKLKDIQLPFQSPLGTQARFQEFVKMILASGGSKLLFKQHRDLEIQHVAPAIGTLILGHKIEGKTLRLFRVEDFDHEWRRLARETTLPVLSAVYKNRTQSPWTEHASSRDPHHTSAAAKSFLSYAGTDAFQRFGGNFTDRQPVPPDTNLADYQASAKIYLRAICRMYLIDFKCMNYSLPVECNSLNNELVEVVDDYVRYKEGSRVEYVDNFADMLRLFLPQSFMRLLANIVCVFAESGECDAKFVHGGNVDVIDRHEEL